MLIPGKFKSCDFVSAHCKGVGDAFFGTADSKGLARAAMPEAVNWRDEPASTGRGGFRPPRKWLNGVRKAPRRSRNPAWGALAAAFDCTPFGYAPFDRLRASRVNMVNSGTSNASPVRDDSCYPKVAVSDCAFCAFFSPFVSLVYQLRDSGKVPRSAI